MRDRKSALLLLQVHGRLCGQRKKESLKLSMARTYRTLSLSLPPEVVAQLEKTGKEQGKTAARVAAEMVLYEVWKPTPSIAYTLQVTRGFLVLALETIDKVMKP